MVRAGNTTMRILVRPFYKNWLNNRLFEADDAPRNSSVGNAAYVELARLLNSRGIQIATWDMFPWETADLIYMLDLPSTRNEVLEVKRRCPSAKLVLELWETPLSRPQFFVEANHSLFDAVVTYDPHLCDERKYFRFFLPFTPPRTPAANPPFQQRKPLVMVNANRYTSMLAPRGPGLPGLPFFGPALTGWSLPLDKLLSQNRGELYSRRRKLARLAEKSYPGVLEVYGTGWQGEYSSWLHKFVRHRPYACAISAQTDKQQVLPHYRFVVAFENFAGDMGYISEKMLDALSVGVVPIYLGDAHITDQFPADAFVDARQFRNDRELLSFARDCSQNQWSALRDAGQAFIASPSAAKFSPQGYAQNVTRIICKVLGLGEPSPIAANGPLSPTKA
jgi:hypothetical protein